MKNPCLRHGDKSNSRRKYTFDMAAKGLEPWGTCNNCWGYLADVKKMQEATKPSTSNVSPAAPAARR